MAPRCEVPPISRRARSLVTGGASGVSGVSGARGVMLAPVRSVSFGAAPLAYAPHDPVLLFCAACIGAWCHGGHRRGAIKRRRVPR
ncbi:hypothetical protein EV126DRAFT_410482 [Verticillium dahliae]|nr:hypothetical protein EV126DRAFT_410482 [Verticillium dahliae]